MRGICARWRKPRGKPQPDPAPAGAGGDLRGHLARRGGRDRGCRAAGPGAECRWCNTWRAVVLRIGGGRSRSASRPRQCASGATSLGQSGEFIENIRDELLAARILSLCSASEELKEIPRLRCGLGPGRRRSGDKKLLQLHLTLLQGRLIDLDLMEPSTDFGSLLSIHATVLIEFYRFVCHGHLHALLCHPLRVAISPVLVRTMAGNGRGIIRQWERGRQSPGPAEPRPPAVFGSSQAL
jgi:hypothetical protein